MEGTQRKEAFLKQLSNQYRAKGYDVTLDVQNLSLEELPNFVIDLVASNDIETVIVDVATPEKLDAMPDYPEKLERAIEARPNWRLEQAAIGRMNDEPFEEEVANTPMDEKKVQYKLYQAQHFMETNNLAVALLYAWQAAEGTMLKLIEIERIEINKPIGLPALVKNLYHEGVLTFEDYEILDEARQYRNRVAHDFEAENVTPELVTRLIQAVRRLQEDAFISPSAAS